MKYSLWEKIASDVHRYYGRREPTPEQVQLWFPLVKHVPDFIGEGVVKDIYKEFDNMPRNLPKAFTIAWQKWQAGNPHKMEKIESQDCDPCQKTGLLTALHVVNGITYQFTYRCGNCRNWCRYFSSKLEDTDLPLRVTREYLESMGIEIVHPRLNSRPGAVSIKARDYIKQAVSA